jgi:enamine deaminase RidA (YjgF/YER057c/UK114 family)
MGAVEHRLVQAGFALPELAVPVADYAPATRAGVLIFTAGQLPMTPDGLLAEGIVGDEVTVEVARECAAHCAMNALAAAATVCDLDAVVGAVKVTGYVASATDFTAQPSVIDAASRVLVAAFGDGGRHAREAVGVASLPLNAPVEVSVVLTL